MSPQQTSAPLAVERLRLALEVVADALASADLARLLSAEEALAHALTGARTVVRVTESERSAVRRELSRARVLLTRCRTVGAALGQLAAARLARQGCYGQYDKAGASALSSASRSSVEVRA